MSEVAHRPERGTADPAIMDPAALLRAWEHVQARLVKEVPDDFRRDEWAYLVSFAGPHNLAGFVERMTSPAGACLRPLRNIAVWLPNNITLLGPLMTIALSLTGAEVRMKSGSRSRDLTGTFLALARRHAPSALGRALDRIEYRQVAASDPFNAAMAASADLRIVFGSDQAVHAIAALPHPASSLLVPFIERRSEAWIFPPAIGESAATELVKVFAVYGSLGCTSPARVVIPDGTLDDARRLRQEVLAVWPRLVRGRPEAAVASNTVMAAQWAAAVGWDAVRAPDNAALLAVGEPGLPSFRGTMALPIDAVPLEQAIARLPPGRIQTIGHAGGTGCDWARVVARSGVKRIVPLIAMHHFGPVWDGIPWFRLCFEEVELRR
jgi:hypothetical protein